MLIDVFILMYFTDAIFSRPCIRKVFFVCGAVLLHIGIASSSLARAHGNEFHCTHQIVRDCHAEDKPYQPAPAPAPAPAPVPAPAPAPPLPPQPQFVQAPPSRPAFVQANPPPPSPQVRISDISNRGLSPSCCSCCSKISCP
jgi:hypothetical protein